MDNLVTALIGMIVVFVGLLILIACITVLAKLSKSSDRKKSQPSQHTLP